MKPNPHGYAVEKLMLTLECLATHPGDARQRVLAASFQFLRLREENFPEAHRSEWRWVVKQVTKCGPLLDHKGEPWRGSVENTMRRIRNSTASKIADKLYKLYWVVSENESYL